MIVNKSLDRCIETFIEGISPKAARAWCLDGPAVDATNEENPFEVGLKQLPTQTTQDSATLILPPHSLTAVEIRISDS